MNNVLLLPQAIGIGFFKDIPVKQVQFVEQSDLVPEDWKGWYYEAISSNAPFSWGDNNRAFVTASRYLEHVKEQIEFYDDDDSNADMEEKEAFYKKLEDLGETYIDLEN